MECKSLSTTTLNKKSEEKQQFIAEKMIFKKKTVIKEPKTTKGGKITLNINQFRLGKKLGSGRFGNVYMVE